MCVSVAFYLYTGCCKLIAHRQALQKSCFPSHPPSESIRLQYSTREALAARSIAESSERQRQLGPKKKCRGKSWAAINKKQKSAAPWPSQAPLYGEQQQSFAFEIPGLQRKEREKPQRAPLPWGKAVRGESPRWATGACWGCLGKSSLLSLTISHQQVVLVTNKGPLACGA